MSQKVMNEEEIISKVQRVSNIHSPQQALEALSQLFDSVNQKGAFTDILDDNGIGLTSDIAQSERDNIADDLGTDTEDCIPGDDADLQTADKRTRKGHKFSHNDDVGVDVPIDNKDVTDIINDIKDTLTK